MTFYVLLPTLNCLYPLNPIQGHGGAGAYLSCHWARGGVHRGQVASPSQGHTERNKTNNHACSHSLLGTILSHQLTWHACFWAMGGSCSTCREPTHTRGEHANSTQKGWDSNQEPSCCEATVLTTTPMCSPVSLYSHQAKLTYQPYASLMKLNNYSKSKPLKCQK